MKFLYASDLHGNIHLYEELKKLTLKDCIEIIALGGDLLPSSVHSQQYEKLIPNQKIFINQFFFDFLKSLLEIKSLKKIFLTPGNWDLAYPFIFNEQFEKIIDLNLNCYKLSNGYELIGYPFVPPTPFRPKDYEKRDDLVAPIPPQKNPSYIKSRNKEERLIPIDPYSYLGERQTIEEDLLRLSKPFDFKKTIYIMHSPPFGTKLDIIKGGLNCGSHSIRKFIENYQPLLTLHGHIHESPKLTNSYIDRIGNTISINPGQFSYPKLQAIVFDLEEIENTIYHTCFRC